MQWKCNYFSRIRPQSHGSRGRSLTPGHLQVVKEKSVFPEWLLEFAGCRWEISDGAAPKTFLRLLWSLADLHGHPSFACKTPVFMQTSTRNRVEVKLEKVQHKPEIETVYVQSKRRPFWNVLVSDVRHNFYSEGEHSPLPVCFALLTVSQPLSWSSPEAW